MSEQTEPKQRRERTVMNIKQLIEKKKELIENKIIKIQSAVGSLETLLHDEDISIFVSAEDVKRLEGIITILTGITKKS